MRYDVDMKHRASALLALSLCLSSTPALAADASLDITTAPATVGSIPRGASRVAMLDITLEASCDADVQVRELAVRHEGLGAASDIERVYLTKGIRRISRAASFSANDHVARLRVGGLTVERCGRTTVTVRADYSVSASSGGEHRVMLTGTEDIVSSAVRIDLTETTAPGTVRATPSPAGMIDVAYLPVHGTVRYGRNRVISRLRLDADGGSDHLLSAITLTNEGSARDADLRNLFIEMSGKRVTGTLRRLDDDRAVFTFDPPVRLGRNQSRVLEVHADVRASSRRTIRLVLEEPSDLDAAIQRQRGARFQ